MAAKKKSAARRSATKAKGKKAKKRPPAKKAAVRKKPPARRKAAASRRKPAAKARTARPPKAPSPPALVEIEQRIALAQNNLRDLIEQSTATSGSATEDALSDRIAGQEAELQRLRQERDALVGRKPG